MRKKNSFAFLFALMCLGGVADATEISANTAIMQAMDKITGQVDLIEVPVNQEVLFGSFSILVRDCKTRAPEETPDNFAFVDIVDNISNEVRVNIFKGWMVSSSPALNPVAHPVYDVWLLKCVDREYGAPKTMSEEDLEKRDNIAMSRNPDLEYSSLVKKDEPKAEPNEEQALVEENAQEEVATPSGEPENLIPIDVPEKFEQNEEAQPEVLVKQSAAEADTNAPEMSGTPEALVIIEEPAKTSDLPDDKPQNLMEETLETSPPEKAESSSENDILKLEKELSEKALSN